MRHEAVTRREPRSAGAGAGTQVLTLWPLACSSCAVTLPVPTRTNATYRKASRASSPVRTVKGEKGASFFLRVEEKVLGLHWG